MTYPTDPKTDYLPEGLARLLEQYKGKPFLAALLSSYLNQIQRLEDATWEVIKLRLLANAEGEQLRILGRILAVYQGSLTDDMFRREISVAIVLLTSKGAPNTLEKITTLVLPSDVAFRYTERRIATILIDILDPITDAIAKQLFRVLNRARLAGVRLFVEWSTVDPDDRFLFLDENALVSSVATHGFSDENDSPTFGGGYLDNVLATVP